MIIIKQQIQCVGYLPHYGELTSLLNGRLLVWMGGVWHVACSPILGATITIERLKQRNYIPFTEYYSKLRKHKVDGC